MSSHKHLGLSNTYHRKHILELGMYTFFYRLNLLDLCFGKKKKVVVFKVKYNFKDNDTS